MGFIQIRIPEQGLYLYLPEAEDPIVGPMSREQVADLFNSGVATRATYLWFEGLTNWIAVGDIPEFDRRQPQPVPGETPESSSEDLFMLYRRGEVVEESIDTVRALIEAKELRRTDVVYDRKKNEWCRSDQHPIVKDLFKSPKIPDIKKSSHLKTPPIRVVSGPTPVRSATSRKQNWVSRTAHVTALGSLFVLSYFVVRYSMNLSRNHRAPELTVTYQEVQRSISSPDTDWRAETHIKWEDLSMPVNVREFFTKKKRTKQLVEWTHRLPERQRREFLHNLGHIVTAVEGQPEPVAIKAIQEYRALKLAQFALKPVMAEKSRLEKVVAGLVFLLILGLVALYSLVIFLLAGERNKGESNAQTQPNSVQKAA